MFVYFFSFITFNLHDYIDGLENVEYHYIPETREVQVFVPRNEISVFFQKSDDISLFLTTKQIKQRIQDNGFHLPSNSNLTIKANFEKYDDYIVGFFNERGCENIYYTKSLKSLIPLVLYHGKQLCIYHLHRHSEIIMGKHHFSKIARVVAKGEMLQLQSSVKQVSATVDDHILIQRDNAIKHNSGKRLSASDEEEEDLYTKLGDFTYVVGFLFLAAGALFYIIIGCFFTPSKYCTCCTCTCCGDPDKLRDFFDNRDNAFYTKTLAEFNETLVVEHKPDETLS